jgi:hypothetical protein
LEPPPETRFVSTGVSGSSREGSGRWVDGLLNMMDLLSDLTCYTWLHHGVGVIGFPDHSGLAESLSSRGGSGCGLIPPVTSLVSPGFSTTGCVNCDRSPVRLFAGILSIVDLLKADVAVVLCAGDGSP